MSMLFDHCIRYRFLSFNQRGGGAGIGFIISPFMNLAGVWIMIRRLWLALQVSV